MTIPKMARAATQKVSDLVRELIPRWRITLSREEARLAIHLRGNTELLESLKGIIQPRITGRASVPVPSDPITCKAMLERDRELQWLLSRLEFIHSSPVSQPEHDDGERPA